MNAPEGLGGRLRAEREKRGVGLEELSRSTKIRRVFLEAMEAERWEEMPSPVFVAGFIKAIAQHLHADPAPWLAALGDESAPSDTASDRAAR